MEGDAVAGLHGDVALDEQRQERRIGPEWKGTAEGYGKGEQAQRVFDTKSSGGESRDNSNGMRGGAHVLARRAWAINSPDLPPESWS